MIKLVRKYEWDRLAERLDRIEQKLDRGPNYVWYSKEPESDGCRLSGHSTHSAWYENHISLNKVINLILECLSLKIVAPTKTDISIAKVELSKND